MTEKPTLDQWAAAAAKEVKGKDLNWDTPEGIVVKPLYNNATEKKRFYHTIYMAFNEKKYHPFCVDDFIKFVESSELDRSDPDMLFFD